MKRKNPEESGIACYIDHTALKPNVSAQKVAELCSEALKWGFASVCVNPCHIERCVKQLGSPCKVKVCCVVGFPLGASTASVKAAEAADAVQRGAEEVDMVLNIGALLDGRFDEVRADIQGVADAVHAKKGAMLKYGHLVLLAHSSDKRRSFPPRVILETCLLSNDQIVKACQLSEEAGADYVKTSTGFSSAGATVEHVELMRRSVSAHIGVKASGGIRTLADARAMLAAGATRLGASSGVAIASEEEKNQ